MEIKEEVEIYKTINDYENYSISNLGNIKNNTNNKFLKIQKSSGYSTISLNKNNQRKFLFIHRLVAQAFIPNPENKLTVNHINHDTHNNRVTNLEWNTQKEQNEHNYKTETKKRTTNRARSVACFDKITNEKIMEFRTMAEASEWLYTKGTSKCLESCLAGIRISINLNHMCHGYIWKYTDLDCTDLDNEIWKEMPEEFTLGKSNYWLSNKGRYKNNRGKMIDLKVSNQYITVSFRNNDKQVKYQLHRIIAYLFVPNLENKPFVNHIDGNKENNCADNLEWVTKSENTKHAHACGLIKKTSRKVNQYDKAGNFIAQFESIKSAGILLKLDKSSIGHVCAKDRPGSNTCGGFIFKYADKDVIHLPL
jgi:hypothetical protein